MIRKAMLIIITGIIVASAPPALALAPILVLEKTGTGCVVRLNYLEPRAEVNWFELPKCPDDPHHFIFDPDHKRTLVRLDGKFWRLDWKQGARPVAIASEYTLPKGFNEIGSIVWFDGQTDKLRVAYLAEEPVDIKKNPAGDEFRRRFPMASKTWVSEHHSGEGVPSWAIVVELGDSGKWTELEAKPTTTQAEAALNYDPVNRYLTKSRHVVSLSDLLMQATCNSQHCDSKKFKLSKASKDHLRSESRPAWKKRNIASPQFGYLPMGDHQGFIFTLEFGDSMHSVSPLFLCTGTSSDVCASHHPISIPESASGSEQISLHPQGEYVLITNEYDGTSPVVFKTGAGKSVMTFN